MLFLKAATAIQSIIKQMPPFALMATGLMIPSSACISWEWPDLYVESDRFRGRIGFFFKNKNWMVIGPAPSYFFCWHASSNFVHGFPHHPVKVDLMDTFALQQSFRTAALFWLFKQDWTDWSDKSGAVRPLLSSFSPVQTSLSSAVPVLLLALLFDELLYALKVQYILSNVSLPLLLTGMRCVHIYLWTKHGPKTVNKSRIYMLYIPQKDLQIYCPSPTLKLCVWLHLPCCVLGRAVS